MPGQQIPDALHNAFTKLVFAFTNPEDVHDTLSLRLLAEILVSFWPEQYEDLSPEVLANSVNNLASQTYLIKRDCEASGLFLMRLARTKNYSFVWHESQRWY